jgi:hypothetical protein
MEIGLGLWCSTPLSTIFQLFGGRKREYPEKTTHLLQVTDKLLSHNVVFESVFWCELNATFNNISVISWKLLLTRRTNIMKFTTKHFDIFKKRINPIQLYR